jgi:hypothetical protein
VRVDARTLQAALKSYGFEGEHGDPITLDGVIGPQTRYALARFDEWVGTSEGGEIWGDYAIIPATDNRSVDVTPDSAARRFQTRGTTYLAEHPEEVVFSSSSGGSAPRRRAPEVLAPLPPSGPFWRTNNPWAWLASAFGFLSLSWASYLTFKAFHFRRRAR